MSEPRAHAPSHGPGAGSTAGPPVSELHRQNEELRVAVAARDAFIAVAAHELRNPMTPMVGQIELLLAGLRAGRLSTDQVGQRLERLQRAMTQYVRRATSLLDVSRLTSGQFRLNPVPCDLAVLVREVADTFAEAAQHAGGAITVHCVPSLPGLWDRLAMEQIVDNLVSNAVKYGARSAIELGAGVEGRQAWLRVRDHGPGISAADRGRIFERFERAVGGERVGNGFGVGLWVVGQLVAAMGGSVTVEDPPGGGAAFLVRVPHRPDAAAGDVS